MTDRATGASARDAGFPAICSRMRETSSNSGSAGLVLCRPPSGESDIGPVEYWIGDYRYASGSLRARRNLRTLNCEHRCRRHRHDLEIRNERTARATFSSNWQHPKRDVLQGAIGNNEQSRCRCQRSKWCHDEIAEPAQGCGECGIRSNDTTLLLSGRLTWSRRSSRGHQLVHMSCDVLNLRSWT